MNRSFLKIVQSRFLPLALLFVFVPVFIWGNPAEIPYRLDKATAGLVGDVHAEICVENDGISIEVLEASGYHGGGLVGGLVGLAVQEGINTSRENEGMETVAPLKAMIEDINFCDALHAALLPMVQELSWPHIIDLQARAGSVLVRKKDILKKVNEGSYLDIHSFYQLSLNAAVLKITTGFTLYLKGSAKGVVKGECVYSSARIGEFEEADKAIALLAGNDGAVYRQLLNQGIEETVKMLKLAMLHMGGIPAMGTDSKLKVMQIRTKHGEGDYGPKEKGETMTGRIIEENENRIIFHRFISEPAGFLSIPRSDIIVPKKG